MQFLPSCAYFIRKKITTFKQCQPVFCTGVESYVFGWIVRFLSNYCKVMVDCMILLKFTLVINL